MKKTKEHHKDEAMTLSVEHAARLIGISRTTAYRLVRHGVDIRRLQQVLGHTNINITAIYLKFNDQDLQEVYANVPF